MKKIAFATTVSALLILIFLFAYFIFVNVIFKQRVLPSVNVFGNDVSVSSSQNLEEVTYANLINLLPSELKINFADVEFNVPKSALAIQIDSEKLLNYGKGSDILKVWKEGIGLATQDQQIDVKDLMQVELSGIYKYLDFELREIYDTSVIEIDQSGYLNNCSDNKVFASLITAIDRNVLVENFIKSETFVIPLNLYEENLIKACRKYSSEKDLLISNSKDLGENFDSTFGMYIDSSNNYTWAIKDYAKVYEYLNKLAVTTAISPQEGVFEIHDNKLYLFKNYVIGRKLNVEATLEKIPQWLNKPNEQIPLVFDELKPGILALNLEILDFTKLHAEGKSRIDITRDGYYNYGLDNAQVGIEELENTIVYPGEEFSYINHIKPQPNGLSVNGRAIGAGICNATTTLFRATLEAGFPITDRSYHAHNYDSYEWGYPLNIVDAAYLTQPVVDFKFINDLTYPILIKTEITRPGDNWQYHTLKIYTSSKAPTRKVEFSDWKRWNVYSNKVFEAHFKRKVLENGVEIRSDEFYSKYW